MINMIPLAIRNLSGVYKITNSINAKFYIGSANSFRVRRNCHASNLRHNKHHSARLQNHVNKYGIETLSFELVEACPVEQTIEREQYYLDLLQPSNPKVGFNISGNAQSPMKGKKHTPETLAKMAANRTYTRLAPEQRKPLWRPARKGPHVWTDEARAARSEAMKGNNFGHTRKITAETCRKISETRKRVAVNQYAANGSLIKTWDSATTARNELGISNKNIQTCCNGVREYAGGFKWRYAKKA